MYKYFMFEVKCVYLTYFISVSSIQNNYYRDIITDQFSSQSHTV